MFAEPNMYLCTHMQNEREEEEKKDVDGDSKENELGSTHAIMSIWILSLVFFWKMTQITV